MNRNQMSKIERANVIFGIAATALSGLLWGGRGMLGAGVGAALACANFIAIRRLGHRAVTRVAAAGASSGQAIALAVGLLAKMTVLFALVWVAVRLLSLPALPFALGFSVFVFSILIVGLSSAGEMPASAGDAPEAR